MNDDDIKYVVEDFKRWVIQVCRQRRIEIDDVYRAVKSHVDKVIDNKHF